MDSSKKQLQEMVVTSNYMITSDCFVVECFNPTQQIPKIVPGQFAQLKIDDNPAVFLRRPFSIHDYDEKKNTISFMIKIVGNGSKSLSALNVDTAINVMFPLGNGFTVEAAAGKKSLLVGGGVGIAPIYLLAKTLRQQNCDFDVILGGKSAEDLLRYDDFVAFSKVYCTTEDGSKGCKGFVTNHRQEIPNFRLEQNYQCKTANTDELPENSRQHFHVQCTNDKPNHVKGNDSQKHIHTCRTTYQLVNLIHKQCDKGNVNKINELK